jgi:hypothetical protein
MDEFRRQIELLGIDEVDRRLCDLVRAYANLARKGQLTDDRLLEEITRLRLAWVQPAGRA